MTLSCRALNSDDRHSVRALLDHRRHEIAQTKAGKKLRVERIFRHRLFIEKLVIPPHLSGALTKNARNARIEGGEMTGVFRTGNRWKSRRAELDVPMRRLVEDFQSCTAGAEQAAGRFKRFTQSLLLHAARI